MPTIEFHGYTPSEQAKLVRDAKARLTELAFRSDIVFVTTDRDNSTVRSWDGESRPFIRVLSRSEDRMQQIRQHLLCVSDVESIIIDFHSAEAHSAERGGGS